MLRLPLCLVCVPHGSQCVVSRSGVPRDFHLPTRILVRVLVPQPERIARRQLPAIFLSRRVKVILPVEPRQALVFVDLVPSPSCGRSCPKIRFFFAVRADFFFFLVSTSGSCGYFVLFSRFDFCAPDRNLVEACCPVSISSDLLCHTHWRPLFSNCFCSGSACRPCNCVGAAFCSSGT
jgi:hypothetical protein